MKAVNKARKDQAKKLFGESHVQEQNRDQRDGQEAE